MTDVMLKSNSQQNGLRATKWPSPSMSDDLLDELFDLLPETETVTPVQSGPKKLVKKPKGGPSRKELKQVRDMGRCDMRSR